MKAAHKVNTTVPLHHRPLEFDHSMLRILSENALLLVTPLRSDDLLELLADDDALKARSRAPTADVEARHRHAIVHIPPLADGHHTWQVDLHSALI